MALTKCEECYYYKLTDNYYFYLKLKATEKGEPGVYEVVVRCECADGSRTLTKFCLDSQIIGMSIYPIYGVSHFLIWLSFLIRTSSPSIYSLLCCYKHAFNTLYYTDVLILVFTLIMLKQLFCYYKCVCENGLNLVKIFHLQRAKGVRVIT